MHTPAVPGRLGTLGILLRQPSQLADVVPDTCNHHPTLAFNSSLLIYRSELEALNPEAYKPSTQNLDLALTPGTWKLLEKIFLQNLIGFELR